MGWRARIGIVFPDDGDSDDDLFKFLPSGVTGHLSRNLAPATGDTVEDVLSQLNQGHIQTAAERLTSIRPDAVAFACSSASFAGGKGYDELVISAIEQVAGCPATTASTAQIRALKVLGVERVAIASPYEEARNRLLVQFMESHGFSVVAIHGVRISNLAREFVESLGLDIASTYGPEIAYRLGKKANTAEAEAVVIVCTTLRTAEMIDWLECDLRKPVVTANQAVMWDALRLAGVDPKLSGRGTLFQL